MYVKFKLDCQTQTELDAHPRFIGIIKLKGQSKVKRVMQEAGHMIRKETNLGQGRAEFKP